jgi:hypothetical protein
MAIREKLTESQDDVLKSQIAVRTAKANAAKNAANNSRATRTASGDATLIDRLYNMTAGARNRWTNMEKINKTTTSNTSKPWTNAEKWGGGAAAVAAGLGALALAKKLRGKKKKAAKKAKA